MVANARVENLSSTPLTFRVEVSPSLYLEGEDVTINVGEIKEISSNIYYFIWAKLLQLESLNFLRILAEPSGGSQIIDLDKLSPNPRLKGQSSDEPTTLL